MTTLAIDIGGTKLAAALIGADGQIRDRRNFYASQPDTRSLA
ncbi:ROK family protein [Escherichia coli]|nr:ROK family protein [Escherichia coli]